MLNRLYSVGARGPLRKEARPGADRTNASRNRATEDDSVFTGVNLDLYLALDIN